MSGLSLGRLPEGWVTTTLGDVAEVAGGIQKQQKRRPVKNIHPFLRVANVGRGTLDLTEVHGVELFEGELERFRLEPGDLLVVEGNGSPDQIGRAATWRGTIKDAVHQNHLIRVRPTSGISARFLELLWNSPVVGDQLHKVAQSTSGLYTLSTSKVKRIALPLPPLAEQHRIVEALENHFSHLDSATSLIAACTERSKALLPRIMSAEIRKIDASVVRLDEVAEVRLGRQRSPKNHAGNQMRPYLRAANVGWKGLLLDDVKEMNFTDREAEIYRLHAGDIVLSEASGSPGEVGKPAIWNGEIEDCCFQNTLIRVRPHKEINPAFLLYFLRSEALSGSFRKGARGVGIHHLGAAKISAWDVPLPSRNEQDRIVEKLDEKVSQMESATTLLQGQHGILARGASLHTALLSHAFTGRLIQHDPSDEPASALLDRIRAEREAQSSVKAKRTPRAPRRAATANVPPPPPPSEPSTPLPTNAVQQELPL